MNVTKTEMKVLIFSGLPDEYETVRDVFTVQLKKISMREMAMQLKLNYYSLMTRLGGQKKGANNAALNAVGGDGRRKFSGKCHLCSKHGHKFSNCWSKSGGRGRPTRGGEEGRRFSEKCNYCGIIRHKEAECRKKKSAGDNTANPSIEDICLMAMVNGRDPNVMTKLKFNDDAWLANTGASSNMKKSLKGVTNLIYLKDHHVTFGNQGKLRATHCGCYQVMSSCGQKINLEDLIVPGLWVNLFSLAPLLKMDWDILTYKDKKETKTLHITCWGRTIWFNKVIAVGKDKTLIGVEFKKPTKTKAKVAPKATATMEKGTKMKYLTAHNRLDILENEL